MKRGDHPNSRANLKPRRTGDPSLNPGGRPRGFAACIKARCGENFEQIAEGLYLIGFGTAAERREFFGESVKVNTRDRLLAIVELRDSGPGRPAVALEIDDRPMVPAFALPDFVGVSAH